MIKKYTLIIGIIAVFGIIGFFAVQSQRIKNFSVSNATGQAEVSEVVEPSGNVEAQPMQENQSQDEQETNVISEVAPTPAAKPTVTSTTTPIPTPTPTPTKTPVSKTAQTNSKLDIRNTLVTFGFSVPSKPRTIDTIILHSSYDALGSDPYSVSGIIAEWKDAGVAPHYLVARDGQVYRLVKDENIAYHAGVSKVPDGRTNVNDFSLGIEMANTKTDEYTDAQYTAVKQLIASLKNEYAIKYVLGHDDTAPGRKSDPWNFDWKRL